MLRAEAATLAQCLVNLLDNAVKFSDAPAQVRVSGTADAARLRLAVEDFGPGIQAQSLKLIFTPFYRGASDCPSTGLGLTILQVIVQAIGGTQVNASPVQYTAMARP